jgi:DNA-binding response OmpR family regulator
MIRIAVVDDIPELREDLCFHLRQAGHQVEAASDGRTLTALLPRFAPHIVVLDLGLPGGEDGLQIAARLRAQQPDIGIIMLTGRTALHERLTGHRHGADHYLTKPVQIDELVLVVGVLERRLAPPVSQGWTLTVASLTLTSVCGSAITVTQSEAKVLEAMARAPQRQCSRRQLAAALGEDWDCYDERRLEALVSRLRRKLTDAGGKEAPLRAMRGQGYSFNEALQIR